jgi:hypothetical protein
MLISKCPKPFHLNPKLNSIEEYNSFVLKFDNFSKDKLFKTNVYNYSNDFILFYFVLFLLQLKHYCKENDTIKINNYKILITLFLNIFDCKYNKDTPDNYTKLINELVSIHSSNTIDINTTIDKLLNIIDYKITKDYNISDNFSYESVLIFIKNEYKFDYIFFVNNLHKFMESKTPVQIIIKQEARSPSPQQYNRQFMNLLPQPGQGQL